MFVFYVGAWIYYFCCALLLCSCAVKAKVYRFAENLDVSAGICIRADKGQESDPDYERMSAAVADSLLEQGYPVKDSSCEYNLRMNYFVSQYGMYDARLSVSIPRIGFKDGIIFTKTLQIDILDQNMNPIFYARATTANGDETFLPTGICLIHAIFKRFDKNPSISSYRQDFNISIPGSRCGYYGPLFGGVHSALSKIFHLS